MSTDASQAKTGLALSIKQPWAWMIVQGLKLIENRKWRASLRGWFGIHAGKSYDTEGDAWLRTCYFASRPNGLVLPAADDLEAMPRGGIVGRARLVDVVTKSGDPLFFGPVGFVLADPEPLDFAPCRGSLSFFRPVYAEPNQ